MNWIDFNIICVGAYKPKILKNEFYLIEAMNTSCYKAIKCYVENWDILNRIQGIWYELWSKTKEYDDIIKSTWQIKAENNGGYQLFIDEKDKPLLMNLFNFYVDVSPIKKIIVLFRHQGYETEKIESCMPINVFLDKLINKGIYGNIAYILSK